MRISLTTVVATMLTSLVSPRSVLAEDTPRLPKSPDELAITLTVNEALEEGPVIFVVTLKNVCKDTLLYCQPGLSGAYCNLDADWKLTRTTAQNWFIHWDEWPRAIQRSIVVESGPRRVPL